MEDESVANVFEGFKKLCIDILSMLRILTFRDHLGMYLVIYKDKHHKAVAEIKNKKAFPGGGVFFVLKIKIYKKYRVMYNPIINTIGTDMEGEKTE